MGGEDRPMLQAKYRLRKKSAFTATYKVNHSCHVQGVTLFAGRPKEEDYPTRVGFVVSKKTHKRAVRRNRLKRLMREAYRLWLKENPAEQKYMSLIFVGGTQALDKNFAQMQNIVKELLRKC
jgi:ribonuclease P protein component